MNKNTTSRRRWTSVLFKALNTFGIVVPVLINVMVLYTAPDAVRGLRRGVRVDFSPYAADFRTVERCLHRIYGNNPEKAIIIYTKKDGTVYESVKTGEDKHLALSEDELQAFRGVQQAFSDADVRMSLHEDKIDFWSDEQQRYKMLYSPTPVLFKYRSGSLECAALPVSFGWYYIEREYAFNLSVTISAIFAVPVLIITELYIGIALHKKAARARRRAEMQIAETSKERAGKIINIIFGALLLMIILGAFAWSMIFTWDNFGLGTYLFIFVILVLYKYGFYILACLGILWRSVYHLVTDEPRRICYAAVDVLSAAAIVLALTVFFVDIFGAIPEDIPADICIAISTAVLTARAVCFAAYKIAGIFRKKKLPAADTSD